MVRDEGLKPRRRPAQARSRAVVDSILEAVTLLCESSDETPTVQAIADRAGVSVGSLYQYFPTKESVLNSLIAFNLKRAMAKTEADLEAAATPGLTPEQAVRVIVRSVLARNAARRRVESALFRYFVRVGDLSTLTAHDTQLLELIARFLKKLGPELRRKNVELAAFVVFNSLRALVVASVVQKRAHLDSPELEEELVHLLVAYLTS
jgi:AcrR family transcriptional regulator